MEVTLSKGEINQLKEYLCNYKLEQILEVSLKFFLSVPFHFFNDAVFFIVQGEGENAVWKLMMPIELSDEDLKNLEVEDDEEMEYEESYEDDFMTLEINIENHLLDAFSDLYVEVQIEMAIPAAITLMLECIKAESNGQKIFISSRKDEKMEKVIRFVCKI